MVHTADGAMDGFVTDAWLANWDSVGATYDNLLIDSAGRAYRIDGGGSLLYRAQGGLKGAKFTDDVGELESLRNSTINPQGAAVFGKITNQELYAGALKVVRITDQEIKDLVTVFGPGTASERAALARKLIKRRDDLYDKLVKKQAPGRPIRLKAGQTREDAASTINDKLNEVADLIDSYDDVPLAVKEELIETVIKPLTAASDDLGKYRYVDAVVANAYSALDDAAKSLAKITKKLPKPKAVQGLPKKWPLADDRYRENTPGLEAELVNKYAPWSGSRGRLKNADVRGVRKYTGGDYTPINRALRRQRLAGSGYEDDVKKIRDALKTAPKPPPPSIVWRHIRKTDDLPWDPKKLRRGQTIRSRGFNSTTIDPPTWEHAAGRDGYTFEIIPRRGAYVDHFSLNSGEKEFLLGDAICLRFFGKKKVDGTFAYKTAGKKTVYQFVEIPLPEGGRDRLVVALQVAPLVGRQRPKLPGHLVERPQDVQAGVRIIPPVRDIFRGVVNVGGRLVWHSSSCRYTYHTTATGASFMRIYAGNC